MRNRITSIMSIALASTILLPNTLNLYAPSACVINRIPVIIKC